MRNLANIVLSIARLSLGQAIRSGGSRMRYRSYLLGLCACIAIGLTLPALGLSALDPWDDAAREALPLHIKIWLGLQMLNNIASLFFVKNHVGARWWFAGVFISHAITFALSAAGWELLAGQVSLAHILCWTPGAIMLWRNRGDIRWPSAFAVWIALVCVFYGGSMIVDLRDAATYLAHVLG